VLVQISFTAIKRVDRVLKNVTLKFVRLTVVVAVFVKKHYVFIILCVCVCVCVRTLLCCMQGLAPYYIFTFGLFSSAVYFTVFEIGSLSEKLNRK